MKLPVVAPSLLAANFAHLEQDVQGLIDAGITYLHYDVMDGHFVPNISFGAPILSALSQRFKLVHDVHLMISEPEKYFADFIKAGATMITFHYEVAKDEATILRWIQWLHDHGVKAGMSIKPATPIDVVFPFLNHLDLVLVMSVEPGFGGQKFIPDALIKISKLVQTRQKHQHFLISVDGGIDHQTGRACVNAGADILVAGSYLFGHPDIEKRLKSLTHE